MRPEDAPPRFVCDAMLAHLARYLRAAGYDTLLADVRMADRDVLGLAVREQRWLLTLDSLIEEHRAARGRVAVLRHGTLDRMANDVRTIRHRLAGAGVHPRPARQLRLRAATEAERASLPPDACRPGEGVSACPRCGRLYWQGSHYRRMLARLRRWQKGEM